MKKESEKAGLKLNIQKTKNVVSGPITLNRQGKSGNSDRFYSSWALKSLWIVTIAMK